MFAESIADAILTTGSADPDTRAEWRRSLIRRSPWLFLQGPTGDRMYGDAAGNEATTALLDDNEYREQPERSGYDRQEITGND